MKMDVHGQGNAKECNSLDMMDATIDAGPRAGHEQSLQQFSLKLEDFPAALESTTPSIHPSHSSKQMSYSRRSMDILANTALEGPQQKTMDGIYGLFARHVEVPQNEWDWVHSSVKAVEEYLDKAGSQSSSRRKLRTRWASCSIFGLPLLHPYSRLSMGWRFAMLMFDLSFTAFWVPLNVGFCFNSYGDLSWACTRADLAGGVMYVLNCISGFQMGVVACSGHRRVVVMDGRCVAKYYIMYGKFLIDTLTMVPFFVLVSAILSFNDQPPGLERRLWSLLSLLRLVRLQRLVHTVKVVYQDSLNGSYRMSWVATRISVPTMYLIILGYQLLVVINLCASLMILLATFYSSRNLRTWHDGMKWVDFGAASAPLMWYHSAYWVITVLTTTGQGQAPRQLGEQIVSNFCAIYGMVFNGLVVGVVGEALMRGSRDASELLLSRRNRSRVSNWAALRHLDPALTSDLHKYFGDNELSRQDHSKEADYLGVLPTSLRRKVVSHIVEPLLRDVHIFSKLDPDTRKLLASMFKPVDVPSGHDLCRQGTPADRLWVVERGSIVAQRHDEANAKITPGLVSLLGETVLLKGVLEPAGLRSWNIRTDSPCRLWELHWEDIERVMRVEPSLVTFMLLYVRERMINKLTGILEFNNSWCELVAVLVRTVKQSAKLDSVQENLEALMQARVEDGSLARLLSSWLEEGNGTSLELGLGRHTTGRKQGLVTVSLRMSRRSTDTATPLAGMNTYNSNFGHAMGAPSPTLTMRYGPLRNSAGVGISGLSGTPRGWLSSGGDGTPVSAIVPAASTALLARQTREARAVGDVVNGGGGARSLKRSGGSGGRTEPGGANTASVRFSNRSRSFTQGDEVGDKVEENDGGGGELRVTVSGAPPPSLSYLQTQSSIPAPGRGGLGASEGLRLAPSLSRFATGRMYGSQRAAAMTGVKGAGGRRSRRGSGRASLSDDEITTSRSSLSGGDSDGPRREVATESDTATTCSVLRGVQRDTMSSIANTPMAYTMVDAGGVPAAAEVLSQSGCAAGALTHGSESMTRRMMQPPLHPQQQHLVLNQQVRRSMRRLQSGRSAAQVSQEKDQEEGLEASKSCPLHSPPHAMVALLPLVTWSSLPDSEPGTHIPQPESSNLQLSPCNSLPAEDKPNATAGGVRGFSTAYISRSVTGGSGSGGGDLPWALSPTEVSTAGCGPGMEESAGGGGGGENQCCYGLGEAFRAAGAARWSLGRACSGQLMPLVEEEEGTTRSCSDDSSHREGRDVGADGEGLRRNPSGGHSGPMTHGTDPGAAPPGWNGRASAPSSALAFFHRARTLGGIARGSSGGSSAGSGGSCAAAPSYTRWRRSVSRSRSATLVASHPLQPPLPPSPAVMAAAQMVQEGGSRYPGSVRGGQLSAVASAAADARLSPQQLQSPLSPPPLRLVGTAAATAAASMSHLRNNTVTSTGPLTGNPIASVMTTAVGGGGEMNGAMTLECLSQLPVPDRVSRLRVQASTQLQRGHRSWSGGADAAGAPFRWPTSPTIASAVVGAGPCAKPSTCATCGRCTCAACKARMSVSAQAVDQGTAVVSAPPPLLAAKLARTIAAPEPWSSSAAFAPATAAMQGGALPETSRTPLEVARAAAVAGAAAGSYTRVKCAAGGVAAAARTAPKAEAMLWARIAGGGGGSRAPDTWRRRRLSMSQELSSSSMSYH